VSADPRLQKGLRTTLGYWGMLAFAFPGRRPFERAFGAGLGSTAGLDGDNVTPTPFAGAWPEVVVLDFDEPGNRPELVAIVERLYQVNPGMAEVLALVRDPLGGDLVDELGHLGVGNLLEREAWPSSDGTVEALVRDLAEIARKKRAAGRSAALGVAEFRDARAPRDVFLCHGGGDERIGYCLRRFLEQRGIAAWYSFMDGQPSARTWRAGLRRALLTARALVVLLSTSTAGSEHCLGEVQVYREALRNGHAGRVLLFSPGARDRLEPGWLAAPDRWLAELVAQDARPRSSPGLWGRMNLLVRDLA